MASQQLQYRIGDIAQRKVTTQDPPRSGLVLLLIIINLVIKPKSMISDTTHQHFKRDLDTEIEDALIFAEMLKYFGMY